MLKQMSMVDCDRHLKANKELLSLLKCPAHFVREYKLSV